MFPMVMAMAKHMPIIGPALKNAGNLKPKKKSSGRDDYSYEDYEYGYNDQQSQRRPRYDDDNRGYGDDDRGPYY